MSNIKSRDRFSVKGLGNLTVREVLPAPGTTYDYLSYLDQTDFKDLVEMEIIPDETGSTQQVLEKSQAVMVEPQLLQTGIDEINFIKGASGKKHSFRYFGLANPSMFQYYCIEDGVVAPKVEEKFDGKSRRILPMQVIVRKQDNSIFDTPEYYLAEAKDRLYLDNLQLWISPRHGYTAATSKVLDLSGFARHGDLNSDFATVWQGPGTTPDRFLRFDGVNDVLDFGDVCDDDGVSDRLFEGWFRIQEANGVAANLLIKKAGSAPTNPGFRLYRHTDNTILFDLHDGANAAQIVSAATVLQNVWKYIAVALDRNGNGQISLNGVASGAAVSVAGVGSAANASNLVGARFVTDYDQIDLGDLRVHNYGAGGLPANIAAMIASHFAAERSYYNV